MGSKMSTRRPTDPRCGQRGDTMHRLLRTIALVLGVAMLQGIGAALAQDYPSKPIRFLIPSGAGSLTDVLPRLLLPEMARVLGQPIIVENIASAGGILG